MTVYRRTNGTYTGTFQYRGKRIGIGTHPTRKAALKAEQKKREEVEGLSPETFEGWAQRWLRDYARPAPRTRETYRYAIDRLVREFGNRPLSTIDRMEARATAQRLPNQPVKIARAMLNDAVDAGLMRDNPFARLRLEQPRGRKDLEALTEEQVIEFADAALGAFETSERPDYGYVMRAWILTAFYTGIRPGESFVLEWSDIDGDELIVQGTKTRTARRRIVLAPQARRALQEMPRWLDAPWIFVSVRGKKLNEGILTRNFDKVRNAVQRSDVTPYVLRHSCATHLMERGVEPWAIAQQLGHADHGGLVASLYGHPRETEARRRIKAAFGENVAPLRVAKEATG